MNTYIAQTTPYYELVFCELHHKLIHGKTPNSYQFIDGHYILTYSFSADNFYHFSSLNDDDNDEQHEENTNLYSNIENILTQTEYIYDVYLSQVECMRLHPYIRNYYNIVTNYTYFTLNIAQRIQLSTGEQICILKTFWIRIIQKKWKNIIKKRIEFVREMKCVKNIIYREIHGQFPKHLKYPTLRGMLMNL
ncbi:hypothetical protein EBR43_12845 [bacterium]|nr:hypothetical protein [bacterium]